MLSVLSSLEYKNFTSCSLDASSVCSSPYLPPVSATKKVPWTVLLPANHKAFCFCKASFTPLPVLIALETPAAPFIPRPPGTKVVNIVGELSWRDIDVQSHTDKPSLPISSIDGAVGIFSLWEAMLWL